MAADGMLLLVLDVLALAGALWVAWMGFKTYRETKSRRYLSAFLGFSFLTLGVASEAILLRIGGLGITGVHTIETLLFLIGFGFLYLSLN